MLFENSKCIKDRVLSSHNPFLNEFNLIYKGASRRLAEFEGITLQEEYNQIEEQVQALKQQQQILLL